MFEDLREFVTIEDVDVHQLLVYPLKSAKSIKEYLASQPKSNRRQHYQFILIDATWPTAERIYRSSSKCFKTIQCVQLDVNTLNKCRPAGEIVDGLPSKYSQIRKEVEGGMSTAEALVCCLADL